MIHFDHSNKELTEIQALRELGLQPKDTHAPVDPRTTSIEDWQHARDSGIPIAPLDQVVKAPSDLSELLDVRTDIPDDPSSLVEE